MDFVHYSQGKWEMNPPPKIIVVCDEIPNQKNLMKKFPSNLCFKDSFHWAAHIGSESSRTELQISWPWMPSGLFTAVYSSNNSGIFDPSILKMIWCTFIWFNSPLSLPPSAIANLLYLFCYLPFEDVVLEVLEQLILIDQRNELSRWNCWE